MSQKNCRAALEGRLATWAAARSPALRLAPENVQFTPVAGETYLRPRLIPADTLSQTLDGLHRGFRGIFQIDIVAPINGGPGHAAGIAAELDTLFPVNGRYSAGGTTVQIITPASAAPADPLPSEYVLPVSLQYRADAM